MPRATCVSCMETTKSLTFECGYCQKKFQRERSLEVHLCEPKRRHQEQNEPGVRLGFQAYVKFFEITQGSARLKTFDDFAESQYYRAFVRWGRYCVDVRVINAEAFLSWLLKHNKKIDHWCSDRIYGEYLLQHLPRENVQDALRRGIEEIQRHCDENPEIANIAHYFLYGNSNRICYAISTGRISAWLVYNCSSGIEFLSKLNSEQTKLVFAWIDPDTWQRVFADRPADTEWAKHVLSQAGL